MRNLILLLRTALERMGQLPISRRTAQRAVAELRETYRLGISAQQWEVLAQVYRDKSMPGERVKKPCFPRLR